MLSSVAFYWCPSGFDWNSGNHFQWPMIHISNRSSIQTSGKDAAISKVIFSTFFSQSQNRKTKNKNRKKRKKQGKNTCHYSSKSVNPCETSCWWLTDVELRLSVPRCSPTGLRVRPGRKSRSNGSQRINMELFEVMWCFGCVCVWFFRCQSKSKRIQRHPGIKPKANGISLHLQYYKTGNALYSTFHTFWRPGERGDEKNKTAINEMVETFLPNCSLLCSVQSDWLLIQRECIAFQPTPLSESAMIPQV